VAPDRPGLLATIVGLLAARGQSVRSAAATTDAAGVAVDEFTVQADFDREPDWEGFGAELEAALRDELDVAANVAARAERYRSNRSLAATPPAAVVLVHLEAASDATVVEIRSADDVGVLFRIARTFTDLDLDIRQARAVTLGQEVVDTFYVCDAGGAPVDDRAEQITAALMAMLAAGD
jgi:[protein-PII] uridylyltransferase